MLRDADVTMLGFAMLLRSMHASLHIKTCSKYMYTYNYMYIVGPEK